MSTMAMDRNTQPTDPPAGMTTGAAMELIRQLIVERKATGRRCTIPIEIVIDDRGGIDIYHTPPRERLSPDRRRRG